MNNEDKNIFDLMDNIPYEEKLQIIDYISVNETNVENDQRERIKSGVMTKLKAKNARRNKTKAGIIAACAALCIIVTGLTPFGQKVVADGQRVIADITGKLLFIPGLGKAEVSKEDNIYILERPVEYKGKRSSVTISSVKKKNNYMEITLLGEGFETVRKLTIEDEKGNKYKSSAFAATSTIGTYSFKDLPAEANSFKVFCSNEIIPITLKKAESYSDYTSMGPTDIKNSLGITLVPKKDGDKIWFDLIQHPSQDRKVYIYGKDDNKVPSHNILVKDGKGRSYQVECLKTFGKPSRFYFKTEGTVEKFTVNIPEITLEYEVDDEISLPMPKEGETNINKDFVVHGFNLKITKILKAGNSVKIFVDTHYDENKQENLSMLYFNTHAMSIDGYSWKYDDKITNQFYEFDINPGDRKLKIKFSTMSTILKGPWTFEINN